MQSRCSRNEIRNCSNSRYRYVHDFDWRPEVGSPDVVHIVAPDLGDIAVQDTLGGVGTVVQDGKNSVDMLDHGTQSGDKPPGASETSMMGLPASYQHRLETGLGNILPPSLQSRKAMPNSLSQLSTRRTGKAEFQRPNHDSSSFRVYALFYPPQQCLCICIRFAFAYVAKTYEGVMEIELVRKQPVAPSMVRPPKTERLLGVRPCFSQVRQREAGVYAVSLLTLPPIDIGPSIDRFVYSSHEQALLGLFLTVYIGSPPSFARASREV